MHPFVGRAAVLDSLVERIEAGDAAAVFVEGEAGGGKTTLVAEALARVPSARGRRVLAGMCDQGYGRPYEPLLRAFRSDASVFGRLLELRIDGLGLVVPELATAATVADAASAQERQAIAANALVQALRSLTAGERFILVIDDLQWASPATIALVRHVVRSGFGERLTVVGTMRTAEIAANESLADLLADLRVEATVVRVRAEPLSRGEVEQLASTWVEDGRLDDPEPLALAEDVWTRSRGNALFAVELLRFTRDRSRAALPDTIALSVEQRLAPLAPTAVSMLEAVAVAGGGADPDLIAAACEADEEQATEALDGLVDHGWLHDDRGAYRYAHDVTREALLERMPSARQRRLHARIGAQLHGRGEHSLAAAAWHLRRAVPLATAEAAVNAAIDFTRTNLAIDAPEEAEEALVDVLDLLDQVPMTTRSDALLAMAETKQHLSDLQPAYDFSLAAAETALAIQDRPRIAAAVTLACHGQLACPDDRVPPMVERVLPLLDDPVAIARLCSGHAFYEVWAADRGIDALPIAEDAIAWARRSGDHLALMESLYAFGLGLQGSTRVAERRQVGEELLVLAEDDGDRFHGLRLAAPAALELGDRAGFEAHRLALRALVEGSRNSLHRGYADLFDAGHTFLDGDLEAAEAHAAHALVDARGANFIDLYAGALFVIRRQQGRLAELGLLTGAAPPSLQSAVWIAARGLAAIDGEALDVARASLAELRAMPLPTNLTRALVVVGVAEVAWALGDRDAVDGVRDDLFARSGTLITIPAAAAVLGAADRFIAMVQGLDGDLAAAAAGFDRAEALERSVGADHVAADTRRRRAATLR